MRYWALGPLSLGIGFDRRFTPGEISDLMQGYMFDSYLRSRESARLAIWIMSPHLSKKIPSIDDLVGIWADGQVMTKKEYYQYQKKKAIEQKRKKVTANG